MSKPAVEIKMAIEPLPVRLFLKTTEGRKIHIKDIPDEGLVALGNQFTEDMVNKARMARAAFKRTAEQKSQEKGENQGEGKDL